MGDASKPKIYAIPNGYVTADPGRNRYIRRQGTSMELPPRLNPEYGRDVADPKNRVDRAGVATDLGIIAGGAVFGAPTSIASGIGAAGLAGLTTLGELRRTDRDRRK